MLRRGFLVFGGQALVAQLIETFEEYPPRQRPQSFTDHQIMKRLQRPTAN